MSHLPAGSAATLTSSSSVQFGFYYANHDVEEEDSNATSEYDKTQHQTELVLFLNSCYV